MSLKYKKKKIALKFDKNHPLEKYVAANETERKDKTRGDYSEDRTPGPGI